MKKTYFINGERTCQSIANELGVTKAAVSTAAKLAMQKIARHILEAVGEPTDPERVEILASSEGLVAVLQQIFAEEGEGLARAYQHGNVRDREIRHKL